MMRNTPSSWGTPAKLLHWTVAVLVLLQIALGWFAVSWPLSPTKLDLYVWHKSIGMLILALMVPRLVWRMVNVAPAWPVTMRVLEQRAAHAGHVLLYLLLFLMPISGWIVNSAANVPFRIFWRIPLPALVAPDKALAESAALVHLLLFVLLSLLLIVHFAAALRHHFVHRDGVLTRMLPTRAGAK